MKQLNLKIINKIKCPFVCYAHSECVTTEKHNVEISTSHAYQQHKPSGFMINVVNSIDGTNKEYLYRGSDCIDVLCSTIKKLKMK